MPPTTWIQPQTHVAQSLIHESLDVGQVCSIVGRCTVAYDGRTQSTLPAGERLVVCKPDGILLIHHATGHKPVNWQPPGGTHNVTLIDSELHLQSHRDSPDERVEIRFTDLRQISAYPLSDEHGHDVTGSEDDLRQRILEQPTLVEEGFQHRMTERETSAGPVDIYGIDAAGMPGIVECKRRRVGPDAVGQLARSVVRPNANTPPKPSEASLSLPRSPTVPKPNSSSTISNGARSIRANTDSDSDSQTIPPRYRDDRELTITAAPLSASGDKVKI